MADNKTRACLVHEPKGDKPTSTDPIFGCFASIEIWKASLKLTYPERDVAHSLENVIYTEIDGFRWYWCKLIVWNEAEAF